MLSDHFPLHHLVLRTPRLELRLPSDEELSALADLAADGIHDPAVMPFTFPWSDLEPALRARSVVQHHWRTLGALTPQDWQLSLTVFRDGEVVALQALGAKDFASLREVSSGSWVGRRFHGQGIGTEMRAAVLHLAFAGLDALEATSGAFTDNPSSNAISHKLGYRDDGIDRCMRRGEIGTIRRFRLDRASWEKHATTEVTIDGLEAGLPLLVAESA
ncbi:RimJ/RimL family protein N-acetyltransferase [Stackebrandtia endophytica]|uniref:RimJ/RimL family protein N-acetyltransferase n=1 Tax=Stackebrandtia endophytica TaxID=1496996 RepID=A0A543AZ28_9ACTN|nr:GNAT family protein [Stackebrandtia endophytica]TQL77828.1 RimJ/RimL family protein N-acetyltransferase [Stackebrandtia endophytica]